MGRYQLHNAWIICRRYDAYFNISENASKLFKLYAKSFKYTGRDTMKSFLGMEVEQDNGKIHQQ